MNDIIGPIQDQINALQDWVIELGRACPEDSNVIPVFDYSPELAAALAVEGLLDDPDEAWFVFEARLNKLMDIREGIERVE